MPAPLVSLKCRLCWRITLAVFLLILVVESIILIVSVIQYKQREVQQLAQTSQAIIAPLLVSGNNTTAELERALSITGNKNGILGAAVYDRSGALIAKAGEAMEMAPIPAEIDIKTRSITTIKDQQLLYAAWQDDSLNGSTVITALDASDVRKRFDNYIGRIIGLITIIIFIVTIGTMLVLDISVLRPLLALRNSMNNVGNDNENASAFKLESKRKDEIGDLINAYNKMLDIITSSNNRNKELANQQAFYHSRHDLKTGLPNQAALEEFLDHELRHGIKAILIQFEYIHFEHHENDQHLLQQITSRLKSASQSTDFIARIGDKRFALARTRIAKYDLGAAEDMIEKILHILTEEPYLDKDNTPLTVDVKAGVATSHDYKQTGRDLLAESSVALNKANDEPECIYAFYSNEYAQAVLERQQLIQELKLAQVQQDFFLVVQPKVTLVPQCNMTLSGAEILIRWQHPRKGLISPDVFIPLAEANGLIGNIQDWVINSACSHINHWLDTYGWSPRLAINISAREFSDPEFSQRIQTILKDHKVSTNYIELEITETTAMQHTDNTVNTLSSLHNSGIRISFDDFGTGYSSLSMLRKLPIDAIKIDKSFVHDIGLGVDAEAVCNVILRLGQALDMTIIAEGVENQHQLEFLCQRKCDQAQGYLFGRPMLLSEFESQWLQHA